MIYILTGTIRSGKTTALQKWLANRTDVTGLLCPDSINGNRYFLKIKSNKEIKLEVEFDSEVSKEEIIDIGNFRFLKSAFDEANDYLLSVAKKPEQAYLIIDELGKLELKNTGLHAAAKRIIIQHEMSTSYHLLLVIRESLLNEIIEHYSISNYKVLKKEDLEKLD